MLYNEWTSSVGENSKIWGQILLLLHLMSLTLGMPPLVGFTLHMKRVWIKGPYNVSAPPTHGLEHKYHMITNMSIVVGIKPFRAFQTSSNPTHSLRFHLRLADLNLGDCCTQCNNTYAKTFNTIELSQHNCSASKASIQSAHTSSTWSFSPCHLLTQASPHSVT